MFNVGDKVYFVYKIISTHGMKGEILKIKKFLFWKKYLIANKCIYYDDFIYWVKEKNIIKKL